MMDVFNAAGATRQILWAVLRKASLLAALTQVAFAAPDPGLE
jgi:hypothetical protein